MKIIKFAKGKVKNMVLALGNFDGVHIGHKKIISSAVKFSRKNKLKCYAVTFEPHPQQTIRSKKSFRLLTTPDERVKIMCELGVDGVIVKKFDKAIRKMSAEQFIKSFLVNGLKVKKIFVGYDFAFGKNRAGNVELLKRFGKKYRYSVEVVDAVKYKKSLVKSSSIRKMIIYGNFNEVIKLLGHPYELHGRVISGTGTGIKLGFPTANISIDTDKLIPGYGVYVGYTDVAHKRRKCVVNIGSRPTFSGDFAIEVHIIGYKGRLNGLKLNVGLFRKIRDEKQFASIKKLRKQIAMDIKIARNTKY